MRLNHLNRRSRLHESEYTVSPRTKTDLEEIIKTIIIKEGNECNLNFIDTSKIKDMSWIFSGTDFNGDISQWDTSNVENMNRMFSNSKFNGDISKWNVSNVEDMSSMFEESRFNQDISRWDVSNVICMRGMFADSKFNQDISKWDVSNVRYMNAMFLNTKFNQDISKWDVSKVRKMGLMFVDSKFNQDISKWDVSSVDDMKYMFDNSKIKEEYKPHFSTNESRYSKWDVSKVRKMGSTQFLNESKWKQLNPSDVKVKEDGRTLIHAPEGMVLRLTIKISKFKDKYKVSFTDCFWDKRGYFFLDKMFNLDEESFHDTAPFELDEQYQKFFKSAKLNEVYYVYVKDSDIHNLNKEFFTVTIRN